MRICQVYFHQTTVGKSNQKIEKTFNYCSVWKSYSISRKDIGDHKKKERNNKIKTTALTYFDNWSNKIKVVNAGGTLKVLSG